MSHDEPIPDGDNLSGAFDHEMQQFAAAHGLGPGETSLLMTSKDLEEASAEWETIENFRRARLWAMLDTLSGIADRMKIGIVDFERDARALKMIRDEFKGLI